MKRNRAKNSTGFTIVELLLATIVFSAVLTITVSAFLGLGRLFFKGVSGTSTNEAAKQALDDVADSIRSASSLSNRQEDYGYRYFCLGNNRYSFALDSNNEPIAYDASKPSNYDSSSSSVNFGLVKDKLPGSSACAPPCVQSGSGGCGGETSDFNNPEELLGDRMRLVDLAIDSSPGTTNLFIVTMTVAYGNKEGLEFDKTDLNKIKAQCNGSLATQEFCSVATLSTGVYRGIHP